MGNPIFFTFYVQSKTLGHVHDTSLSVYVTTSQYDQTSDVLVPFSSTLLFS